MTTLRRSASSLLLTSRAACWQRYPRRGRSSWYGNDVIAIGVATNTIIRNTIICHNSFSAGGSGTVADHNLVGIDPLFVSAASFDLHPSPTSPAIGAGVRIATVTTDADGVERPRSARCDIGADESAAQRSAAVRKPPRAKSESIPFVVEIR